MGQDLSEEVLSGLSDLTSIPTPGVGMEFNLFVFYKFEKGLRLLSDLLQK